MITERSSAGQVFGYSDTPSLERGTSVAVGLRGDSDSVTTGDAEACCLKSHHFACLMRGSSQMKVAGGAVEYEVWQMALLWSSQWTTC